MDASYVRFIQDEFSLHQLMKAIEQVQMAQIIAALPAKLETIIMKDDYETTQKDIGKNHSEANTNIATLSGWWSFEFFEYPLLQIHSFVP